MGLYQKLDLWSILDELEKMTDYYIFGNERESIYWDFYSDQINELGVAAADMFEEIEKLKDRIWREMPARSIEFYEEDECTQTAVAWFNTAACMLSDTDMRTLLENENIYGIDDEWGTEQDKEKRIRALERLTKHQQMWLYTEVIGFITRFLQLKSAFDVITSCIRELDYHQSFVMKKDGAVAPDAAYL